MVAPPKKTRVFVSFDYDHDDDIRVLLLGQAKNHDTPFSFEDWSIKQETKGWTEDARKRIKRSDVVIVICGHNTNTAVGVTAEINIAREEGVPFHLLNGRKSGWVRRPQGTSWLWDTLHFWTWPNISSMCTVTSTSWWKKIW
jgi:hypothetical protein